MAVGEKRRPGDLARMAAERLNQFAGDGVPVKVHAAGGAGPTGTTGAVVSVGVFDGVLFVLAQPGQAVSYTHLTLPTNREV